MSPLSVAQYLPAGHQGFDMVIFDEASQITTWDAVGAIARGRQSIVVGDPKQLPPTNFFGRVEVEEEDVELHEKDLPSILDEVAAAGLPTHQLNWHYRSRERGTDRLFQSKILRRSSGYLPVTDSWKRRGQTP